MNYKSSTQKDVLIYVKISDRAIIDPIPIKPFYFIDFADRYLHPANLKNSYNLVISSFIRKAVQVHLEYSSY
ncbi:hypothetical protein A0H76_2485 [Hepatospora eriocheir]|uniref:Uncharacterized protein n=1 Tax=Hepatospora eriocheir TaxID=1081669 RepID=A0A1X0QF77_9MICR|nr:hypothetical protein A0H76_2485 [Hepatospora eriocheir]